MLIRCETRDGVEIVGEVFPAVGPERGVVILAHGLPSGKPAISDAPDEGYPGLARRVAALGFRAAVFNFRGTGESGGHLEIDLWPDDLAAVIDFIERDSPRPFRCAVVGFSAGGAASILQSARDERIERLITLAAPADYSFLAIDHDPETWFAHYKNLGMVRAGYAGTAREWAARFTNVVPREAIALSKAREIVIIHGGADDLVPVSHADILARAAGPKARKIILPGVAHQTRRDERAAKALLDILAGS